MLSASTPSLRLGISDSDFIFILPRVPPLTRLHPGLIIYRPACTGLKNSAHFRSHITPQQTPIYQPKCLTERKIPPPLLNFSTEYGFID